MCCGKDIKGLKNPWRFHSFLKDTMQHKWKRYIKIDQEFDEQNPHNAFYVTLPK